MLCGAKLLILKDVACLVLGCFELALVLHLGLSSETCMGPDDSLVATVVGPSQQ